MLPARFERTSYRLGGGRSIQLSYGSQRFLNYLFYESYLIKDLTS